MRSIWTIDGDRFLDKWMNEYIFRISRGCLNENKKKTSPHNACYDRAAKYGFAFFRAETESI
jgi:hypothetical protein